MGPSVLNGYIIIFLVENNGHEGIICKDIHQSVINDKYCVWMKHLWRDDSWTTELNIQGLLQRIC